MSDISGSPEESLINTKLAPLVAHVDILTEGKIAAPMDVS